MSLLNHASGSRNPATSFSALWAYLEPALDHILKGPSNDLNGKPPAIDFALYAGIHSACYNYFTAQTEDNVNNPAIMGVTGTDVYDQLDKYFAEACIEIGLGAPLDDITLIEYIIPSFNRFHSGAQSANRLLSYVNRHYVKRAVDEDRGWLRRSDVDTSYLELPPTDQPFIHDSRQQRMEELKKWGAGDSPESVAFAESCAEAGSSVDRVVPVLSMAHRRFRTEIMEKLLATPKMKAKAKAKASKTAAGSSAPTNRPKGRLARAVKELLECQDIDDEKRYRLASGLANILQVTGIREEHILRKKLNKFLAASTQENPNSLATTTTPAEGSS